MSQLPKIFNNRLSRNSSNKEIFNAFKWEYENLLKHSGYSDISLTFEQSSTIHRKHECHCNFT